MPPIFKYPPNLLSRDVRIPGSSSSRPSSLSDRLHLFKIGFCFALALTLALPSAVQADSEAKNIRFTRISLEDGLSQAFVTSAVQDSQGFMWFGTQEGLNRFDGYTFRVFSHDADNPGSLAHDLIKAVTEDSKGRLWIGTDGGGLNLYNPVSESFTRYVHDPDNPESLSSNRIWVIHEDPSGNIWLGTDGGGINLFNPETGTARHYLQATESGSTDTGQIRGLARGLENDLWAATDGEGLVRLDPADGSVIRYLNNPEDPASLSDNRVRSIYADRDGTIWAGTYTAGLNRFDPATNSFEHFRHGSDDPSGLAANDVRTIFQDRQNTLWVGTDNGLNRFRPESETFDTYAHDPTDPYSLGHNRVVSIYEDRGGVLWIGTYGGLSKWNTSSGNFLHYKHSSEERTSLNNGFVSTLTEGPDGSVWVGTFGGGLNRFDRSTRTFTYYTHDPADPESLIDNRIMSLHVDRSGTIWVGTFSAGLERFDPATGGFVHHQHDPDNPNSISGNDVATILNDSQGNFWVGTYRGGLNLFDRGTGKFTSFRHDPDDPATLSSDRIVDLHEDRDGALWIGTYGGGLNRFDRATSTFSAVRHDPEDQTSLSRDEAWAITEDSRGDLWIGTQGGGVNHWSYEDRKAGIDRFERFTTQEGLISETVNALVWDLQENLWISTNSGISRLAAGDREFIHYDTSHGLQSREFNFAAATRSRDGVIFFGGINGFNMFFPEKIRRNTHVPPIQITQVLKFNEPVQFDKPLSELDRIDLTHEDSVIAFEFAALDFTAPKKNRYMHMLEGFDDSWIDLGTLRRATYTNLAPGDYTFRVKASNNDGVWNEQGVAINLIASPPPWKTWWAYSGYALIAGMVLLWNANAQSKKRQRAQELATVNDYLEREIEQRRAKEIALQVEKERAQRYFDIAEVIMVVISEDGSISLINQRGARTLGYREGEVLGKNWLKEFVPEDVRDRVAAYLKSGSPRETYEYPVMTREGDQRVIAWHTTRLTNEDGSLTGYLSSGSDLTQLLQLREEKEVAEAASRAKSQFLANMSHEIRTPMNGMLGMIEMLRHSGLTTKQGQFVGTAHRAATNLLTLLNDVLDLSKIEAGKLDLELTEFDLEQLVGDIGLLFSEHAQRKGLDLGYSLPKTTLPFLVGDSVRIRQILSNLVGNAIKFTDKGRVDILVTVDDHDPEGVTARFEIRDTGIGLDPGVNETIFESFQQADGSTTRKFGGTGLGLAISKQLIDIMGGQIGVDSIPNEGSSFWFSVPLQTGSERPTSTENVYADTSASAGDPKSEATVPASLIPGSRILLVEDNPLNQEVVRSMLEHLGGHADFANNGKYAVELTARIDYDLILMDCQMPEMDGFEATKLIREAERFGRGGPTESRRERVPIVAMTASALAGDREKCLAAGMDDYLSKPFTLDQLRDVVEKWAAESRPAVPREKASSTRSTVRSTPVPDSDAARATTEANPPTIDPESEMTLDFGVLERIRTLQVVDAPDLLEKVLTVFSESVNQTLQKMNHAVETRDADALRAGAHSLKSSSANVGAMRMSALCLRIEDQARSGSVEETKKDVASLGKEYDRVTEALAGHRGKRRSS